MPTRPSEIDLARYRLVRLLGRGGMGEVHLADDQVLHRPVAIKFVAPDKVTDPEARKRLLREARSAAGLDHDGICTVYEAGLASDGRECIVMQYVEGETLSEILERGPLEVHQALDLTLHVAEALGAAHAHRVIHRDLKPGNIIVTKSGRPKLLDFGLAKVVPLPETVANDTTVTGLTTQGTIVGTSAYMAPEQALQRPVDGRSDLFSLGVVLYECLTGRRPFSGETPFETIGNVVHLEPPPPSTLRPELDQAHDRLCHRLLAKNPNSRFQSAAELVGALRLTDFNPDGRTGPQPQPPPVRRSWAGLGLAAAMTLTVLAGGWWFTRPTPLPEPPADAARWYQKGTEAIREGAYLTARTALTEAVRLFPGYALAYARLAEADAELDDERAAQEHLLRVSTIVADESRLQNVERLRLQAVRALVLRDVDGAVDYYRQLTRGSGDAGAWLDLGRAQESAGLRTDARASYERAISQDRQYAAAYLRLAHVEGLESRRDEALAAYAEAERLFAAASNMEGRTELLLRRGSMFDAFDELKAARADLESARALAESAKADSQVIRSQLGLSSVMASEGALEDAEQLARAAVMHARTAGLDALAADGLIDLAATLQERNRLSDADSYIQQAVGLADERAARRTAARGRVQLASLRETENRPKDALALVDTVLPFLKSNHYRRFESRALSIAARAHERLDNLAKAREIASSVLRIAETVKDDGQVALAATNLAGVAAALGQLPDALRLRERVEAIHRGQGNEASLPYDLANRAELLIRLGRRDDAATPLAELEAGIAAKKEAYVGRSRRLNLLRALAAATALRCEDALTFVERVTPSSSLDTPGMLAPAIGAFCRARLRRPSDEVADVPVETDPTSARERQYWLAFAALERGDPQTALREIERGLTLLGVLTNDELRWRLAALGEAASHQSSKTTEAKLPMFSTMAAAAIERVSSAWGPQARVYKTRPDLVDLERRAGHASP